MELMQKPIVISDVFIEIGESIEAGYILSELWEQYLMANQVLKNYGYEDLDLVIDEKKFHLAVSPLLQKNILASYLDRNEVLYSLDLENLKSAIAEYLALIEENYIVIKRSHIAMAGGLTEGYILSHLDELKRKVEHWQIQSCYCHPPRREFSIHIPPDVFFPAIDRLADKCLIAKLADNDREEECYTLRHSAEPITANTIADAPEAIESSGG